VVGDAGWVAWAEVDEDLDRYIYSMDGIDARFAVNDFRASLGFDRLFFPQECSISQQRSATN
jgi:hypothetical protein